MVVLDDTDREILKLLVENGRLSFTDLGRATGLSPHAAAERVRRLQRAKVITGFTATVDPSGVGRGLDAIIDVRLMPKADPDIFEQLASELRSVREVAFVTGRSDYHVRVSCRDANDLNETIRALRQRGGAAVTETRIVMRSTTYTPRP